MYEQTGYVVCEALDEVHDVIDQKKILNVRFDYLSLYSTISGLWLVRWNHHYKMRRIATTCNALSGKIITVSNVNNT